MKKTKKKIIHGNDKKKIKNLRYSMSQKKERLSAFEMIDKLGISYIHYTPQIIGDQIIFWGCSNIPDDLPDQIDEFNDNPDLYINDKEIVMKINKVLKSGCVVNLVGAFNIDHLKEIISEME